MIRKGSEKEGRGEFGEEKEKINDRGDMDMKVIKIRVFLLLVLI